jgi:hypothetical protein
MDPTLKSVLTSLTLLLTGALVTFLINRYWFWRADVIRQAVILAEAHDKLILRVIELERQLGLVNQAILPMSTAFQAILVKELTHAHTPEMDALLVKLGPPYVLTPAEEQRLAILLNERYSQLDPLVSESEREAAMILPLVMKRVRRETEQPAEVAALKVVTVVAPAIDIEVHP